MKKLALIAVAGMAAAAGAQSITYNLSGVNMTDAGRGLNNAAAGDVIRISMSADFSNPGGALSLGLAKFDLQFDGAVASQIQLAEDPDGDVNFDLNGNERGRHPHMRQATSDKPTDSSTGASLMTPFQDDADTVVLSDAARGGIDLGTFPPTFNPLIGPFPIASGETFFVFDFVYQDGSETISVVVRGAGRIFRNAADGSGQAVSAPLAGSSVTITPAPASLALIGMGGLVAARRRRA